VPVAPKFGPAEDNYLQDSCCVAVALLVWTALGELTSWTTAPLKCLSEVTTQLWLPLRRSARGAFFRVSESTADT